MEYKPLDQMVSEYESAYSYAVRTPYKGIFYTTADSKELENQATLHRESLEYEVDKLYVQQTADPESVNKKEMYTTLVGYLNAIDLERRAKQVVVNRRLYLPRKAVTYVTSAWGGLRNAWNWLTGRKRSPNRMRHIMSSG